MPMNAIDRLNAHNCTSPFRVFGVLLHCIINLQAYRSSYLLFVNPLPIHIPLILTLLQQRSAHSFIFYNILSLWLGNLHVFLFF